MSYLVSKWKECGDVKIRSERGVLDMLSNMRTGSLTWLDERNGNNVDIGLLSTGTT